MRNILAGAPFQCQALSASTEAICIQNGSPIRGTCLQGQSSHHNKLANASNIHTSLHYPAYSSSYHKRASQSISKSTSFVQSYSAYWGVDCCTRTLTCGRSSKAFFLQLQ